MFSFRSRHKIIFKNYLFFLATQPHGDTSGLFVLVLPPCGWSTGFIATPLTFDFKPLFFKEPAFPRTVLILSILEQRPIVT